MIRIGEWDKEFHNLVRDWKNLSRSDPARIKSELMGLLGKTCVEFLKANTPKRSGELADGWYIISQTDTMVEIGNKNDGLVDIVDKGTSGHLIKGRPVLKFEKDGEFIYASQVWHPGTTPQPFIQQVLTMMDQLILDFVESILARNSPLFTTKSTNRVRINKTSNIAGISGLGGPNRNQGRGRIHITPIRTGRRVFKRRLGLRRRTGHFINERNIDIG